MSRLAAEGSSAATSSGRLPISDERLRKLYGLVKGSHQKTRAVRLALNKESMENIGIELGVRTATAEVYVLDGFVAGAPLDFVHLQKELSVTPQIFWSVKAEIERPGEISLKTVKDNMNITASYNQIRFVIASLINKIDSVDSL